MRAMTRRGATKDNDAWRNNFIDFFIGMQRPLKKNPFGNPNRTGGKFCKISGNFVKSVFSVDARCADEAHALLVMTMSGVDATSNGRQCNQ